MGMTTTKTVRELREELEDAALRFAMGGGDADLVRVAYELKWHHEDTAKEAAMNPLDPLAFGTA